MRQHRAIVLALSLASVALAAVVSDSCEDRAPERARARTSRRARTPRIRPLRAWSSSAWIAPPDAGLATGWLELEAEEDAAVEAASPQHLELIQVICWPLATSLCEARAQCGCGNTLGCIYAELDRCESWLRCAYPPDDRALVVDHGRVAACIARMTADHAHCIAPPPVEECYSALVDPAEHGDACHDPYAGPCVGGQCVDGRCERTPALGERCDGVCAGESFCDDDGRCRPLSRLGCAASADCGSGRACVAGRCELPRFEGQPCEDDEWCAPRLACERGRCAHTIRCERHRDCLEGDQCSGTHAFRCTPARQWPMLERGEECTWGACEEGLVCLEGQCAAAPVEGEPCPDRACARGLACEWGVCVPRDLGLGAPCASYADRCAPGTACHYGDDGPRCRRARALLEPCEGQPCAQGLECDAVFESGRCTAELCDADWSDPWSCDVD